MLKNLHFNLKIRITEILIVSILNNMLFPFLAIYFALKFGAALAGILLLLTVIVGIVAGFYGGHLGDRIGRRKTMLIAEVIRLIAFIVMVVANSPWFELPWLTFAMLAVNSICWGIAGPALDAMIIDVSTPENRKFYYTLQYWAINLAMIVGATLGGFLFETHRFEIFIAVTIGSLISITLLTFFIKESFNPKNVEEIKQQPFRVQIREMIKSYRVVFKDRIFIMFIFASLLIFSIETQARSYSGVRLVDEFKQQTLFSINNWNLKVDGVQIFGIINAENSLAVIVLALFLGRFIKKFSDYSVLYTGILFFGLGYSIIGISNSAYLLMIMMLIATIGELMWVPVQQSIMAELPPESNRGSYMAVNGIVIYGPNMLGSLAVTLGAYIPSLVMGMIFFATGLLAIGICEKVRQRINKQGVSSRFDSELTK